MEFILNLVWAMLAVVCSGLWMRHAHRSGIRPQVQAIALLMVLVILLPVISVTDDLQTLQFPAELDCCARRPHAALCPHSNYTVVATAPPPVMAELSFGILNSVVPELPSTIAVKIPALASIQNRPPPVA